MESEGFKTELLDDYKVKVTGNNFSQTISLLDLGVKKDDLEYKNPKDLDKSDNQNARVYKNGNNNLCLGFPRHKLFEIEWRVIHGKIFG